MNITDTVNVPISYLNFLLPELTDSETAVIRAPGGAGRYLKADTDLYLSVMGRRAGTSDAYVDLATTPLSLAWADPADVEIKARAGDVGILEQPAIKVKVTKNP